MVLAAHRVTSDDVRGDVTIAGSRPRRERFNGVRAVYVVPAAAWQPTDAPPLLASNYVTEDGGEGRGPSLAIPVGTRVTPRPPDRSERALLTHSAPTSGVGR